MAAQRQVKSETAAPRNRGARPSLVRPDTEAAPSPAAALQARLSAEIDAEGRWSPLATVSFVLVSCGGFWSVAFWGLSKLIHSA